MPTYDSPAARGTPRPGYARWTARLQPGGGSAAAADGTSPDRVAPRAMPVRLVARTQHHTAETRLAARITPSLSWNNNGVAPPDVVDERDIGIELVPRLAPPPPAPPTVLGIAPSSHALRASIAARATAAAAAAQPPAAAWQGSPRGGGAVTATMPSTPGWRPSPPATAGTSVPDSSHHLPPYVTRYG